MMGFHREQLRFTLIRQAVVRCIHIREHCIAARRRYLAGIQNRSHGGNLIVRVIRVPTFAYVELIFRFLANLGYPRVVFDRSKKAIDVNVTEHLRYLDMTLGRQVLIADKNYAIFCV